jgi:dihydropteroate synthase
MSPSTSGYRITSPAVWRLAGRDHVLADPPWLMGIVNVTPDSFSDGGQFDTPGRAVSHAQALIAAGATIIDVGGESTRPGSDPIPLDEELRRVVPVVEALRDRGTVLLSVDTSKAEVARRAIDAGADIINDVAGLRDPALVEVAARTSVGLVVMHMRGTPKTMQRAPQYDDVVAAVFDYFVERLTTMERLGIARERIVLDPGLGFGKTTQHNLQLCGGLARFHELGRPICLGPSRKGFIGKVTGRDLHERQAGTVGVCIGAWLRGVQIFRVHDVAPLNDALRMLMAMERDTDFPEGTQ